jgi:phosphate transport system substrate-binding protein
MTTVKGSWILISLGILSLLSCTNNSQYLIGAGSSFDNPLFSKMFYTYFRNSGMKVNYQSIGSGGGISQLISRTIDFGASDVPMNAEQDSLAPSRVLHIPITVSAVVLSYNLPELKDTLRLSPEVLAALFLGRITHWNDTAIAALNPGVALPDLPVVIAHRSDGSGTSNIFTSYLSRVSKEWNDKVGRGSSVNWPAGLGGKGNEGVAGLIRQTHGAIGYIELAFAMQNKMSFGKIRNKAGRFITPSISSISAAANIPMPADGKASLADTDAPDGYPISSFSWVLIYQEQDYRRHPQEKATQLLRLLDWMIHDGQQYSSALYYAPLSPSAVSAGEAILGRATYDGKAILTRSN